MKQELFKEMYNGIQMDREQKERILSNIKAEENKKRIKAGRKLPVPAIATACACVMLFAGVPVLAANTGIVDSIVQAFGLFSIDKPEVTEEQKKIYSEYGNVLDNEIKLEGGTLKFDAVVCDKNYICIPFSVINPDNTAKKRVHNENLRFFLAGSKSDYPMGMITMFPQVQEDGSLKGCYQLNVEEEINPGDKILVKRAEKWDDDKYDLVSEFNIQKIAESCNIPVDKELLKKKDMGQIYSMEISPLSLRIEGKNKQGDARKSYREDIFYYDITVELKDGTIIKQADTGQWGRESENDTYIRTVLFAAPVDVSKVAGVRIKSLDKELWIPAGNL